MTRTIIENAVIVTVNETFDILDRGSVLIEGDQISDIVSGVFPDEIRNSARKRIDACGGIVMPGLVNTHAHLPMTLFRGYADDLPLMTWLQEHMGPVEGAFITEETARTGSLLGCVEMLLSGTTTVADGYFHETGVAMAMFESGIRGVPAQGIIDFPAPGVPDPEQKITVASEFVKAWTGRSDRITPAIFCHAPYTCSRETLVASKKMADELGVKLFIHVSETRGEVEQHRADHGVSPVKWLADMGVLGPDTVVVHCVWLDADDIKILKKTGSPVSHNPESNLKLGSGIAPVPRMLDAGVLVGLGTDGCASNNNLDLMAEMATTAKLHKGVAEDPTVMNAETVIRMATMGGACALGLDDRIGSIEKGKQADLIILDMSAPHAIPVFHPASHIVYSASGHDVRDVFVAGKRVVHNREVTTIDIAAVIDSVRDISARIKDFRASSV